MTDAVITLRDYRGRKLEQKKHSGMEPGWNRSLHCRTFNMSVWKGKKNTKKKKTHVLDSEDKDKLSWEETGSEIKRLTTILKRNRVCQSRWQLVKKIRLLLLFPTAPMELCKPTEAH